MNKDFWLGCWLENRIAFHKTDVNPFLKRFRDDVAPSDGRTLVPMCGKSADLAWLAGRGNEVVGVDLSEIAATSFASERGFAFTVTEEPPFTVRRAENMTYLVGDFFNLTPERFGRFDFIYDRAAIIALPADLRPAYARQLRSLLKPGGHILLITLEYDSEMAGPPFSVPESEIRAHFAGYGIDKLDSHDCLEEEPRFKERGLTWLREAVYHLAG